MSQLNPIYVYNRHRSPVSALCFGRHLERPVIVTASNDGEIHVWELINFSTLIIIRIQENISIIGLESYESDRIETNEQPNEQDHSENQTIHESTDMNEKLMATAQFNKTQTNRSKSKSRSTLRFLSQTKSGQLNFVHLIDNEQQIIEFKVKKTLPCSDCTFCSFELQQIGAYLFILYIASESSNSVNLLVLNADDEEEVLNDRIITIDQHYGIISSMRLKIRKDDLVLLTIGAENGGCLLYTSRLKSVLEDRNAIDSLGKEFDLKFKYDSLFKDTFISSLELNDSFDSIQLICGSVEDCLIVIDLQLNSLTKELNQTNRPKYLKLTNKGINSIVRRTDGKLIATCGWDGRIRLFSSKSLRALAVLTFHKQTIETLKFSTYLPNSMGYLLAAGGEDKLVTIWSIYNDG